MSKSEQDVEAARQWHKTFAIETNHLVWSLLGKTERTAQETSRFKTLSRRIRRFSLVILKAVPGMV